MNQDKVSGVLLIATWINCALFMLETIQVVKSLRNQSKSWSIKYLVLWCYIGDVVGTAATGACVYILTITHWGDPYYSIGLDWPMMVQTLASGIVAFSVQSFLILRYSYISRNKIITFVLFILSIVSIGGAFAVAIGMHAFKHELRFQLLIIPAWIWFIATATTDWGIAGALVWELWKIKSRTRLKRTDWMIKRLISNAIRTGSVASMVATAGLIAYLRSERSNISVAFGFCVSRVYSLTLLYNINSRGGLPQSRYDNSHRHSPDKRCSPHLSSSQDTTARHRHHHHRPRSVQTNVEADGSDVVITTVHRFSMLSGSTEPGCISCDYRELDCDTPSTSGTDYRTGIVPEENGQEEVQSRVR